MFFFFNFPLVLHIIWCCYKWAVYRLRECLGLIQSFNFFPSRLLYEATSAVMYSPPCLVSIDEFLDHVSCIRWSCDLVGNLLACLVFLCGERSQGPTQLSSQLRSLPPWTSPLKREADEGQARPPRGGNSAARTEVCCWSPPELREIHRSDFPSRAPGSSVCSVHTSSQALWQDFTPTNLQVGLLILFHRVGNWGTER